VGSVLWLGVLNLEPNPAQLIEASPQRWGSRRKDVEAKILKFLAS
jgi:hypothetical protein